MTDLLTKEMNFDLLKKFALVLILIVILFTRFDSYHLSEASQASIEHRFKLVRWELNNIPQKWLHILNNTLFGKQLSKEKQLKQVYEFLKVAHILENEKTRLKNTPPTKSGNISLIRENKLMSEKYITELSDIKEKLRPQVEEFIESELSLTLIGEGFGYKSAIILPPVDIRLEQPPTVLITSPRDNIQILESILLNPDLSDIEKDKIENTLLKESNLSAIVSNLAGLATYPSLVSDQDTLRGILQTAAHEWLHSYLIFKPLGQNFRNSAEMYTLNETIADLAGRELGDTTFARMGGNLNISSNRYKSGENRYPTFTEKMRKTRLRVDELLNDGEIDEAEQYMKNQWWLLKLGGYNLRKLNQAYFAFHGMYGEGHASISPIGDQVKDFRKLFPTVGQFIKNASMVNTYKEFIKVLENRNKK